MSCRSHKRYVALLRKIKYDEDHDEVRVMKAVIVPAEQTLGFDEESATRKWLWPYLGTEYHLFGFVEIDRKVWEGMLSACPPAEHAVVTADMVKAGSAYAARFVGNWFSDQHIRQLLEAALAVQQRGERITPAPIEEASE